MLVDTHCHIQSIQGDSADLTAKKWHQGGVDNPDAVIDEAQKAQVKRLICVGTDVDDSENALDFVKNRAGCWASVGVHPHEADKTLKTSGWKDRLARLLEEGGKVVAVGETGLDYYYEHSPKQQQIALLEQLLNLAQNQNLPVIFHVRDAYEDFWPVLDNFRGIKGVLHSYSSDADNLKKALKRDLYVGFNGIMTFTKDEKQLEAAQKAPAERILLETDAPYLTPSPYRGKVCKPKHIKTICEFLCDLRGGSFDKLASQTTQNAKDLFKIN